MNGAEKAKEFKRLLRQEPSVLTVCVSSECRLANRIHDQYPDTITLEWTFGLYDLKVDRGGLSGTLECGFVWVPWSAIVNVRPSRPPPPALRVIKGGK